MFRTTSFLNRSDFFPNNVVASGTIRTLVRSVTEIRCGDDYLLTVPVGARVPQQVELVAVDLDVVVEPALVGELVLGHLVGVVRGRVAERCRAHVLAQSLGEIYRYITAVEALVGEV